MLASFFFHPSSNTGALQRMRFLSNIQCHRGGFKGEGSKHWEQKSDAQYSILLQLLKETWSIASNQKNSYMSYDTMKWTHFRTLIFKMSKFKPMSIKIRDWRKVMSHWLIWIICNQYCWSAASASAIYGLKADTPHKQCYFI